jgi:UDP-N-acetylmuramoyl-L-alanyl-D-glutamate--2,6-diaminopimelate ligase
VDIHLSRLTSGLAERGFAVRTVVPDRAVAIDPDPIVRDAEHDSRRVAPGAIFACIRGERADGHEHAAEAAAAGAVALLVDHPVDVEAPQIVVGDVREAVGPVASEVHGHPSQQIALIGVTGTNGKTTTVRMVCDVLRLNGRHVTEIGTLTGSLTTPEATELQRKFAGALGRGDQHRVDGSRFRIAGFTNLGRDHLDHHLTIEAYFAAKARLFEADLTDLAVIDVASPHGRLLAQTCTVPVVELDSREIELVCANSRSSRFRWRGSTVDLPLGGAFNVANAALAAEIALALGIAERDVASALAGIEPVPGRFESIDEGQPFTVLVDYAHTPDGLEAVLEAARQVADGTLTVVFGAGGDRDREKRPRMGSVARKLADRVVVTSDNPRGEDPEAIIAAIIAGMPIPPDVVEPDRRLAIRQALAGSGDADLVVIAGKGHEPTQTTGSKTVDFDDRTVAREELRRLKEISA